MNMKKTFGVCATLLAALLCAVPQSVQAAYADGKIRSVEVVDANGIHTFPNKNEPLKVGDTIRITFRLVNLGWGNSKSDPSYKNPWSFAYTGPSLTGDPTFDAQLLEQALNKPHLGLWMGGSGVVREAKCVNEGTLSNWLTDIAGLGGAYHYTDLVFEYTIQGGDLALPLQFANKGGTGPATENGGGYYLKYNGEPVPWALEDSTRTVTNEFKFGDAWLPDDPDFNGQDLSDWELYAQSHEVMDIDLSKAGIYVQAIDFDATYFNEEAGVWRSIAQGSTTTEPSTPTIAIDGGAAKPMVLYLWTDSTNIAEVVKGGQVTEVGPYEFGDGVTRTVGKVEIAANDTSVPFSIKATGSEGDTTQVFLAATPTNIFNASGVLITNFISRTVQVGAPLPPGITVTVNGKAKDTVTANADYATALVGVNVTLSEAWNGSDDLTIPIKVTVKENAALNIRDYMGMSTSSTDDNVAWNDELTVRRGALTATQSLWMYANRGTVDTENGLLVEVDTNRLDAAARAFFTGKFIAATVVVNRSTPEIASALPPITDVEANSAKEITINVADAYGELHDPCRYTVYWSRSGGVSASDYVVIPDLAATAAGDLTFTVTYLQKGDYTSRFYVENQDGKKSDPLAQNASVSVSVKAQKVVEATTLQKKFPEDAFNDQEVVTLNFGAEGFSMPNGETEGYVFFVPRNANASNLVECSDLNIDEDHRWMAGYPVYAGETEVGPFLMTLYDGDSRGITMGYDIVVRTAQNWDEGTIVTSWNSKGFSFGVTNVVPEVTQVSMSGTRLTVSGGTMGTHASLGVSKTFTAQTTEPSDLDLYADEANGYQDDMKAFTTEWTFDYGNGAPDVKYVYGPPSTALSYAFTQAGNCTVTVRMCDKDMDHNRGVWGPEFTFTVVVDAKPSISLSPFNGLNMFYETSIGQSYSKINVGLSMVPTSEVTVHLVVSRAGADDGNYPLPVLNTYDVTFGGSSPNTTNAPVWFTWLDGTALGDSQGYNIQAVVTNTTVNADGVAWTNLYAGTTLPVTIVNSDPEIMTRAGTNEIWKAENENFKIEFTVRDVPADVGAGLSVTWQTSEGFSTNYPITATSLGGQYTTYKGSSPMFSFTQPGSKTVTLLIEDKDGGFDQQQWKYYVVPSKALLLYPRQPDQLRGRGGSLSAFSAFYTGAAGIGDGRVWADGAVVDFNNFVHKYTFDPRTASVNVYARGYKVGEIDNGSLLPGPDITIDANGNHYKSGVYSSYYESKSLDGLDSYFYCWILDAAGEGGGGYTGSLLNGTFLPAVEAQGEHIADGQQLVTLAEYEEDAESYPPTVLEAIFSKERYPADNVGDINQDGIPDMYAVKRTYDGGKLYEFATGDSAGGGGGETGNASDIKPKLTTFNGDGDYIPPPSMTGGGIPATADGWSNVGQPFKAEWEVRGFHLGLNYRVSSDGLNYNVRGAWVSNPSFSPAESNAIVYMNKKLGIHQFAWPFEATNAEHVANWNTGLNKENSWIPENRTDPTMDDTDGDGFPDGFEYYFWYRATVGWIDDKGEWKRLVGEKFQLEDIAKGVPISSDNIAVAFNPTVAATGSDDDIAKRDTDNDGLTDLEELALGTNPVHWDTDGDGMSDLWEIMRGKNPLKAPDPTKRETNLDGDYMASFTTEKSYSVLTFTNSAGKAFTFAVLGDGSPYVDNTGALAAGVSNINSIAVYRYGGKGTDYAPVSRGSYGRDESISYFGEPGKKYAGREVKGDIHITKIKPLEAKEVDISEMGFVSFETNKALRLVHDQVYAQFGFDPRTAWGMNVNGYVCNRWDPHMNPNYAPNVGETGLAVNTSPYSDLDEYLVLKYRYNALSADAGMAIRSLSNDLSKIAANELTIADVLAEGTTNPNVPFTDVDYTVTGEGESETTQQGATVPTFTSTNHGADTDEDGVPDGWELYVMFDPNEKKDWNLEVDGDFLAHASEYAGTDSCNAYEHATNGLGKVTIYENHPGKKSGWFNKFFPTDPWDIDTDGDGISDRDEGISWEAYFKFGNYKTWHTFTFIYGDPADDERRVLCIRGGGLNPCTVDTDGDLLPDPWERDFAGVVFMGGSPVSIDLQSGELAAINRNDGILGGGAYYITAGMDGTFGPRNGVGDSIVSDAATGTRDPRTGTVRNFDFDNDGLQNFQEYLVQTLRHLRYDDTETPLMGSYLPNGLSGTRTYVGFLPMQTWDGAAFFKAARAAGFTGLSAYGGEGFRYRDLGYFIRPPKPWDVVAQDEVGINACVNYEEPGYRVMLRPAGLSPNAATGKEDRMPADSYATTDPRLRDSDNDGMDDYYEIFHGLNPLLGNSDVIGDAYRASYGGIRFSAYYNAWVGWPAMPPWTEPVYDAMKYPWFMGVAEADADGDGLRNTEEALLVNTPSPQNYHTDPTPLWMTDSSAKTSFTAQYYGRDPVVTAAMGIPDLTQYFWFGNIVDYLAPEGSVLDYMFSFEENEGFDTDHDWLPDGQELTHAVTSATDPRNGDDPDRRQAMYFPGANSAVASYSGAFSRPIGENYAMLRKFTVEAWVRPDGGVAQEQTILARLSDYPNSTLSNALHQVRANFRIGLDAERRVFGQFDNSDAVESASPNGFGTVTVRGTVLDAEAWSHVALTYDGASLVLYVNGSAVAHAGSSLIPANGIVLTKQSVTPDEVNFGESGYKTYPGVFLVGADAANVAAAVLNDKSSWSNYRAFYKGWVDEVRVWDGVRTSLQIAEDSEKRYSFADVKALREDVYSSWKEGATRNENDGKPNLPAELVLHYSFQQLPSEVNSDNVAFEPSGFTEKVVDNVKWNGHGVDLRCGWWSAIPIASGVYDNRALVPWIRNTCGMLPAMDGSTPDSQYWSELLGGVTIPAEVDVTSFMFPNTSCPYPYWNYMAEGVYREYLIVDLQYMVRSLYTTNVVDLVDRFEFDKRTGFVGGADLLPLGGAFAKRCPDFWDGQGATDANTATMDDLDNDGLPGWWEDYAAAQYGIAASNLTASAMVDYVLPSRETVRISAWQAYQIDLARGMLPGGVYDNAYNTMLVDDNADGIPDWWQKMFGVFDSDADDDPDNDGLSNYQEWLISWGDANGYGVSNGFPLLDPTRMCSQSDTGVMDYFAQGTNPDYAGYYMGEIVTDHDFMEDWWESGVDVVSRNRYDSHEDPDRDGWSNFAEVRALTPPDKSATLSLVKSDGSEDHALPGYPIPTIRATVANNSGEAFHSSIVMKAWKGAVGSGTADATWIIPGDGEASQWNSRFLGLAPNRKMKFNIGPGNISEHHVMVEFYDPLYYIENITYETNGTIKKVTYTPHTVDSAEWGIPFFGDNPQDDSNGRDTGTIDGRGWVNYVNGDIEIDFAAPAYRNTDVTYALVAGEYETHVYHYDLTRAFWRVRWMSRLVDVGSVKQFSLCEAHEGYLREGKNTFVAFADLNGNGELDVGEPSGFARDVNVGFDCVNVEIALSSDAVAFDIPAQASSETSGKSIVRVVRTGINGEATRPRMVYSRSIDLTKGKTFTEADFVKSNEYSLDWNQLVTDAASFANVSVDKISTVEYTVYEGEEGTNVLATFTRSFAGSESAPKPTGACTNAGYVVSSARPVLKWQADSGYSAFALQIAKDESFVDVVYATTNFMPVAYPDGCRFVPEVYVGDGLEDGTTYYWRVAQLNAKFRENAWSEVASFRTAVDSTMVETGYGRLAAEVRYFGPANAALSNVVVGVYATADFATAPVARRRLVGGNSVSTLVGNSAKSFLEVSQNVMFDGIDLGSYYVMAFIDTNGNGVRDPWESWGYACGIGTDVTDRWSPVSFGISSSKVAPSAALVVMEDTDVNQNLMPDCLEDMSNWGLATETEISSINDSDRDGLTDNLEGEFGTAAGNWDTDGDGMPDGWEALFAETDPVTPDAEVFLANDVMAYAVTNLTVVTTWIDGNVASATNKYVVIGSHKASVGDNAAAFAGELARTYKYADNYGLGRVADASELAGVKIYAVEADVEVVLVHAQVYEAFGFNPKTANPSVAEAERVNTKPFTALDKYLMCRYLENVYGLANEDAMNVGRTWKSSTLSPDNADNDMDGVPDGWELYVMFGTDPVPATLGSARISPFNGSDTREPNLAPAGDITVLKKWNGGAPAYDPWSKDSNGDGIPDNEEVDWNLSNQFGQDDNDQLANFTEYIIGVGFVKYPEFSSVAGISSTNSYSLSRLVTDYFHRIGKLYLGEMFTDHDFMEDLWEDKYPVGQVTRGLYDPSRDPDSDGWSNFAECRAGTDPTVGDSYGIKGISIRNYPVPAIHASLMMGPGEGVLNGNVVVQAFTPTSVSSGLPDAVWTVTASSDEEAPGSERSFYLGINPCREYTMTLGPGSVKPGTVSLEFLDPNFVVVGSDGKPVKYGNLEEAKWEDEFVEDRPNADRITGALVVKPINGEGRPVGTITYGTGRVTIDFTRLTNNWQKAEGDSVDESGNGENKVIHLQGSHVRAKWTANPVGSNAEVALHLTESDAFDVERQSLGHVREGLNTFVAFLDSNGDGKWNPGEPYGVAKDVDVGWSDAEFSMELTRTTPIMARFNLAAAISGSSSSGGSSSSSSSGSSSSALTDRDVINTCRGYAPNETASHPGTNMPANVNSLTRVRVVRNWINRAADNGSTSYSAVLLDSYFDLSVHPTLTEADLLATGKYDLDWGSLTAAFSGSLAALTNVAYRVVIGDGDVGAYEKFGNNLPILFFNTFEARSRQTPTVPDPKLARIEYAGRPTFRWSHANSINKPYPAFRLRIYTDAEKSNIVYDSGTQRAPARDANGMYEWTAPVYAGMVTSQGTVFEPANNYYWAVSMLDAKFTGFSSDETVTQFRLGTSGNLNDGREYGSIAVRVKYFGALVEDLSVTPSKMKNIIRVQAFTTPSFSGQPVGEAYVTDVSSIASGSVIATNAVICGVPCGSYYVRAFVDTKADGVKADWESWGYACSVGEKNVNSVWTPKSVTVSYDDKVPTATVFIEDADTDNDGFPDGWEWNKHGNLTTQGTISGDTFFAAVNPNLLATLPAYDQVASALNRAGSSSYPQIVQLMSASPLVMAQLLSGEESVVPDETTAVRIKSFSLENGLELEVVNESVAEAGGVLTFNETAEVQLYLVGAASPDFADAVEVPVKELTIRANDTVVEAVSAEELAAARAKVPNARFFKAVIK